MDEVICGECRDGGDDEFSRSVSRGGESDRKAKEERRRKARISS